MDLILTTTASSGRGRQGLADRRSGRHEVKELEVGVRLQGEFESSDTRGDNSKVVATDTMKNTVQALAHRHPDAETEPFAVILARDFLSQYEQVLGVTIETRERRGTAFQRR